MTQAGWKAVAGEEFSIRDSIGGVRGLLESSAPGVVFVTAYLIAGGYKIPTVAAVATVAAMVIARLVARQKITHALGGVFGVVLGAVWAWRFADPGEYFVPGFWIAGAYLVAIAVTILVRWPVVGVVVAVTRGANMDWRKDPRLMKRFSAVTAIFAGLFALKLAVQLPLYFAGAVGAVGIARIAMGFPLYALTLWIAWIMVHNVELPGSKTDA